MNQWSVKIFLLPFFFSWVGYIPIVAAEEVPCLVTPQQLQEFNACAEGLVKRTPSRRGVDYVLHVEGTGLNRTVFLLRNQRRDFYVFNQDAAMYEKPQDAYVNDLPKSKPGEEPTYLHHYYKVPAGTSAWYFDFRLYYDTHEPVGNNATWGIRYYFAENERAQKDQYKVINVGNVWDAGSCLVYRAGLRDVIKKVAIASVGSDPHEFDQAMRYPPSKRAADELKACTLVQDSEVKAAALNQLTALGINADGTPLTSPPAPLPVRHHHPPKGVPLLDKKTGK